MTDYVLGFLMNVNERVALVRKNRPDWQAGKLNGIGGHIEPGETPEQAQRREFLEETGADIRNWDHFATVTGEWGNVFCYRAWTSLTFLERGLSSTTDEAIEIHDAEYTPAMLPNLSWLLPLAFYTHDKYEPILAKEL